MFEIYQLRYFLAVVETGSFTKAAQRARVTQPTLSAGIKKLEAALGTSLFNRTSRRVFLTEAGSQFLEHARAILSHVQSATAALAEVQSPDVLRLGMLITVRAASVSAVVGDFLREQTGCVVELFEGTEQELHNRLDAGTLDVALTVVRPPQRRRADVLYEEGYSLAIAARHPLARRASLKVTELADQPIVVRSRCEVLSETSRFFTDHNVRPRLVYRTEQDERALSMVGAGLGVTVMPDHYTDDSVCRLSLEGFDHSRRVGIVYAPGPAKQRSSMVRRFSEFAASQDWPHAQA